MHPWIWMSLLRWKSMLNDHTRRWPLCVSVLFFRAPPTALLPKARYERIIGAFGGKGFFAETPDELRTALESAFEETRKIKKPVLINVMISPYADRKPQVLKSSLVVRLFLAFGYVVSSTRQDLSRVVWGEPKTLAWVIFFTWTQCCKHPKYIIRELNYGHCHSHGFSWTSPQS